MACRKVFFGKPCFRPADENCGQARFDGKPVPATPAALLPVRFADGLFPLLGCGKDRIQRMRSGAPPKLTVTADRPPP